MLRVITMTAYRRPAYTREGLAALARCEGIAEWVLLPNVAWTDAPQNPDPPGSGGSGTGGSSP